MALVGAVVGQIGFGSIADMIGRRRVFIMTCSMVIFGAVMSATVQNTSGSFGIFSQLTFWRFILGVGIGGEYPLSASITSESSQSQDVVRNLAMVFSMQGIGTILCSLVLVTVTNTMGDNYDTQWRLALGLGAVPMACSFYFRWKMHETSWANEINKPLLLHEDSTTEYSSPSYSIIAYFREGLAFVWQTVQTHWWALLGTAGSWFVLDVVFYANGLFSGQVTTAMGLSTSTRGEASAALILQCIALPGYMCTILFIDRIGPSNLQLIGFVATAFFFLLLAVLQPYLLQVPPLYIILYGLTFFFQNFGANATTYIIPSIIYPTNHRATCHGISAAWGKMGAIVGAEVFLYLQNSFCRGDNCTDDATAEQKNNGLRVVFSVCGALSIFGFFWSYFLVKNVNGPLLEVSNSEEEAEDMESKKGASGSLRTQSSEVHY
eukprot:CAMPEP_0170058874 /NCGR_PEP_ID=MMETSP0019_2-20121128/1332_1 /TAXON_ID=98059 /ORGANISM="Dinobryon sp., Strain UTEXLB2267" /LENGTH=434 /DNA_ID=CAMNT_0010263921 /DNA_START=375 /DNA_END=1679 /DNA_ORIENTATION=-